MTECAEFRIGDEESGGVSLMFIHRLGEGGSL